MFAYMIREALELMRDPIRLGFATLGTAFLMVVMGAGISTDVDNLTFAVLDHDKTPESRAYLEEHGAGFRPRRLERGLQDIVSSAMAISFGLRMDPPQETPSPECWDRGLGSQHPTGYEVGRERILSHESEFTATGIWQLTSRPSYETA